MQNWWPTFWQQNRIHGKLVNCKMALVAYSQAREKSQLSSYEKMCGLQCIAQETKTLMAVFCELIQGGWGGGPVNCRDNPAVCLNLQSNRTEQNIWWVQIKNAWFHGWFTLRFRSICIVGGCGGHWLVDPIVNVWWTAAVRLGAVGTYQYLLLSAQIVHTRSSSRASPQLAA